MTATALSLGSWLAEVPDGHLVRLLRLRPDLAQPTPGSIAALAARATWRLPAAGFAERAGTWVNVAHHAQSFRQAIRPPAGVWPEGRLYWNMLGRRGLYDAALVRRELAESSAVFAALAGEMPALGVDLRVRQLA